jgi:toxin-antitoxin system PIN domain toxin
MPDLPDASVWIPLSVPDHVHHERARRYWEEEASDALVFCRVTAMALLRFITNRHILNAAALDAQSAWREWERWLSVPQISFRSEPPGVDEWLRNWAQKHDLRGGNWTDAYLAAFAAASGYRLVAFDSDFKRFDGVEFLHLEV